MRFIKTETNINFIGKKNIAFVLSLACIAISFLSLIIHKGPRLGIDFAHELDTPVGRPMAISQGTPIEELLV